MPARRLSDTAVVAVAGVLMVVLGAAGAIVAPAPDAAVGTSSTYSSGPSGARAAYLTLRRLGYDVERSIEPLTALKADPATSVLILSGEGEPSNQDRRALERFLKGGGIALTVGERGAEFLGVTTKVTQRAYGEMPEAAAHRAVAASPLVAGAPEITIAESPVPVTLGGAYVTLYGDETPVVATAQVGSGRAIWLAAATPLANDFIAKSGNLQLLLNVVGPPGARRIVWDEHYHGHTRSLWSYVVRTPLVWALAQAGLIGCAAFLTFSRRHGPMRPPFADARTSPMEFVDMLGALYKRAGARAAAVSASRARLRRTVVRSSGLPSHAPDGEIARAAAAKAAVDADALEQLLADSERAGSQADLTGTRALSLTQQLQKMTARIQHGRTTGS